MKLNIKIFTNAVLVIMSVAIITSCNKELPEAEPIDGPSPASTTIADLLNDPDYSILKAAVARAGAGVTNLLADKSGTFTLFAPNDAAFNLSGIPSAAALAFFRPGQLDTLLKYHIVGGERITTTSMNDKLPNLYLQSSFVLVPPSAALPPGLRMPIFPSKRGTFAWVNNIPIIAADIEAGNGIVHKVATLVAPPARFLWDRIDTDPDLTYLKAAIQRADSGTAVASTLQAALQNPVANLTLFAPTNLSFQQLLTGQITLALVQQGLDVPTASATATALASSPTVFQNPALASVLTPTIVKGLVVYHILGNRQFSVNLPTVATGSPTLLNSAIPTHPGVTLKATFGPTGVTAATIAGAANPGPSNILINPTPDPGGTSDQHYINGTIHEIDQVLRPQ